MGFFNATLRQLVEAADHMASTANIFQNKSSFLVKVLTEPEHYSGPLLDETKTADANDEMDTKYWFVGRILDPKMAHRKFLPDPCDLSIASDISQVRKLACLHTRVILSTRNQEPDFSVNDYIIATAEPGTNGCIYDLQYMSYERTEDKFAADLNAEEAGSCTSLASLDWTTATGGTGDPGTCNWSNGAKQYTTTWQSNIEEYKEWNGTVLKNGQLDEGGFLEKDTASGAELIPPAMADFKNLQAAYQAKFPGKTIKCAGYRTYDSQVSVRMLRYVSAGIFHCGEGDKNSKGEFNGMAATPGRSNHGWGAAFDIDRPASGWTNGQEGESPEFMWLNKNGPTYNFVFGVRDEHWHMDWMPFSSQTTGGIAPTAQSSWVSPTTADYANV